MTALRPIVDTRAFPGTIAILGAAGRFGQSLVRHFHRSDAVVSIDDRGFPSAPEDVRHFQTRLRERDCHDIFRRDRVQAVVHLAVSSASEGTEDAFTAAMEDFSRLLFYCDRYKVKKLVLVSSADVYGARPRNPQFFTEESPLLAAGLSVLRDVDMMAQSFFWKRPDIETVILRPTHIAGSVSSVMARYLRLSPIPTLLGYDPMIQLVHEDDVISAVRLALEPGHRGIYNIAGPPPVPLSRIIDRLGKDTIPIPHTVARPALAALGRLGKTTFSPAYVDYIRYVCMVDDDRAREQLGYRPEFNLEDTIEAIGLWE